jgi:hypothetical protein
MKKILILAYLVCLTSLAFAQDKVFKMTPQDTAIIKKDTTVVKKKDTKQDASNQDKDVKIPFPRIFGGNFSLWFGNSTLLDISPLAAYKITEKAHIGIGGTYRYYNDPYISTSVYGGRAFFRYMLFESIYAHVEYESLSVEYPQNGKLTRDFVSAALLGATYRSMISEHFYSTMSVFYNTNYVQKISPYANPLVIRIGFEYEW